MQELTFGLIVFVAMIGIWVLARLFRGKGQRRSPEAIRREASGRSYRPDSTAHLEVKANDRSIVAVESVDDEEAARRRVLDSLKPSDDGCQFEIEYLNPNGRVTRQRITVTRTKKKGEDFEIQGYCELAQAHRTFLNSRVLSSTNLWTGKPVKDLAKYARSGALWR